MINDIAIIKSVTRSLQTDHVFYWIDRRDHGKAMPYREKMLRRLWKEACEAAKVEAVTVYNAFRHTTITKWLDDGMSEDDASALVGHRCGSTIKKYDRSKRLERLMRAKKNAL
jgi:site-specific recombinase XerD